MTNEKRRFERMPVGTSVAVVSDTGSRDCRGTIVDMSAAGMTFETDSTLELGQTLYLKSDKPFEVRGEICRVKSARRGGKHRYGVKFHFIAARGSRPSVN